MIGVYDSGIGGLSVWKELNALMPERDYAYVADSAHCPYGEKSSDYIIERADRVVRFLLSRGTKAYLRRNFDIPFVGMEPAVKPAALASRTGVVGVLATANTFKGSLYRDTVMKYASDVRIVEKVGRGLVEAVERGDVPYDLIREYVAAMKSEGADVIVLGCTHFPFLQEQIAAAAGLSVRIINPAPAVAAQTRRVVDGIRDTSSGLRIREFYSTGDMQVLRRTAMSIDPTLKDCDFHQINI